MTEKAAPDRAPLFLFAFSSVAGGWVAWSNLFGHESCRQSSPNEVWDGHPTHFPVSLAWRFWAVLST